jgi:hypothetical protein
MRNVLNTVGEKIKRRLLGSLVLFSENRSVYENVEKCVRAAAGKIAARFMLD